MIIGNVYVGHVSDRERGVMAKGPKGGSGAHGKAGAADKGKSDIDRTGKFGKHHGGNLSGSAKGGKPGGKK